MNVGGISGQNKVSTEKRRRIFNSIRHNNDIVILTETKFKSNEMNTYKQDWNSGLLASCTSELRAQAGVAILFRRGLAVDILSHGQDSNGRVVWALVEIYAKKILIIGVYAPAQGDNPKFFTDDVFPILGKVTFDHSVLGGDWNLGMDPSMDYFGYSNADHSTSKLTLTTSLTYIENYIKVAMKKPADCGTKLVRELKRRQDLTTF